MLGAYSGDGRLQFCGAVGTGMTGRHRTILAEQLAATSRRTSPFAGPVPADIAHYARWVTPKIVGDVEYREFRGALRHPSWKGLRVDVPDIGNVVVPA